MTPLLDRALDLAVVPGYSRLGYALRGLRWDEPRPPGASRGRTVLVTGASSGLGEAACEGLAAAGANVHMLVRDLERRESPVGIADRVAPARRGRRLTLEQLRPLGPRCACGASRRPSSRAERLDTARQQCRRPRAARERTADGIELTFATNVLGPFLLTSLLLPALRARPPRRV